LRRPLQHTSNEETPLSEYQLNPGVVTGAGYKALVEAAKQGGYALPAVNVVGSNGMNAVKGRPRRSDIIISCPTRGGLRGAGMRTASGQG
jgi:fructose-bisphosphate aldolase class II